MIVRLAAFTFLAWAFIGGACGAPSSTNLLVLERTIALPDTGGRIDHLDIDLEGGAGCFLYDGIRRALRPR
jgi:hypothetical protein